MDQLKAHLSDSANIRRGPVDAADFKTYIFPLLFCKRNRDVWDNELRASIGETGVEQLVWFPESHRLQNSQDCHTSRCVPPPLQDDIPPLSEAIAELKAGMARCCEAEERLATIMAEEVWLSELQQDGLHGR